MTRAPLSPARRRQRDGLRTQQAGRIVQSEGAGRIGVDVPHQHRARLEREHVAQSTGALHHLLQPDRQSADRLSAAGLGSAQRFRTGPSSEIEGLHGTIRTDSLPNFIQVHRLFCYEALLEFSQQTGARP